MKYLEMLKERIKALNLSGKNSYKLIMIVGIAGMALIFLSSVLPHKTESSLDIPQSQSSDEYRRSVESELKEILSEIEGVGGVRVMVTLSGTEEYIYVEDVNSTRQETESGVNVTYSGKHVTSGSYGGGEALLQKIVYPQIGGVVVVCEGGDIPTVRERVYSAVSAALEIPTNKIYVTKIR